MIIWPHVRFVQTTPNCMLFPPPGVDTFFSVVHDGKALDDAEAIEYVWRCSVSEECTRRFTDGSVDGEFVDDVTSAPVDWSGWRVTQLSLFLNEIAFKFMDGESDGESPINVFLPYEVLSRSVGTLKIMFGFDDCHGGTERHYLTLTDAAIRIDSVMDCPDGRIKTQVRVISRDTATFMLEGSFDGDDALEEDEGDWCDDEDEIETE